VEVVPEPGVARSAHRVQGGAGDRGRAAPGEFSSSVSGSSADLDTAEGGSCSIGRYNSNTGPDNRVVLSLVLVAVAGSGVPAADRT
jgi:hypothetical protein